MSAHTTTKDHPHGPVLLQLSALVAGLPGLLYRCRNDANFTTEFISEGATELTGYPVAQFRRNERHFGSLIHPEDRQRVWDESQAALGRKQPFELTYRIVTAAGATLWVWEKGRGIYDAAGGLTALEGFVSDITVHKRAEAALQESDDRFRAFTESAPDAIVIADSSGEIVVVNSRTETLFGYPRSELLGQRIEMLLPDRARDRHRKHRDGYFAQPSTRPMGTGLELHGMRKDGAEFPVEVSLSPLKTAQGLIVISVIRDITERKRIEESRREGEEKLRGLYELSPLGIALTDAAGRFVDFNESFQRICGYSLAELKALDYWALTPRKYEADEARQLESLERTGKYGAYEKEYLRKDGSLVPLRLNGMNIKGSDGQKYVWSIVEDITERKEAETRIKYLNRVYATLSGINALIVHVTSRGGLFRDACRIAVAQGGFRMSWIGSVDRSRLALEPVASAGVDEEILAAIRERFSRGLAELPANTLVTQAIREKKAVVANDLQSRPLDGLTEKHLESGIRSMAILPLIVSDEVAGVFTLYARETNFFHDEELKLLTEMAGDIAFAMDHLDKVEKLDYLAYYDPLTGLANRSLFLERVSQYLRSAGSGGHKLAVGLIDLERFKSINDSLGRPAGDALLKQVAQWLTGAMGDANLLARFDADHFAAVLPDVRQEVDVTRFVEKSLTAFQDHSFRLDDAVLRIATKVGIALFPDDGIDAETLIRNAETALKKAKAGGERYLFYAQAMNERVAEKLSLENQLREALAKEEFVLHYQPKVDLDTRRIVGVEALLRWQSPELGLVPPMKFIPLMEETGLILPAGAWALRQASLDHRKWTEQGIKAPRIAVNVSAIQLRQKNFVALVEEAIMQGLAPVGIDLEITESLIMQDVEATIAKLKAVRALGLKIAIDDFGTGYSSLAYLAKLPVNTLKIDRSFIITMLKDPDTMTLVSTMISLAHSLRLSVVAEGVETEEQARMLRLLRCDEMQGYLFSKPVPAAAIATMLARGAADPRIAGAA